MAVDQSWSLIKWRGVQQWRCYWPDRTDRLIDNLESCLCAAKLMSHRRLVKTGPGHYGDRGGHYDNQEAPMSPSHWPWHLCLNNIDCVRVFVQMCKRLCAIDRCLKRKWDNLRVFISSMKWCKGQCVSFQCIWVWFIKTLNHPYCGEENI